MLKQKAFENYIKEAHLVFDPDVHVKLSSEVVDNLEKILREYDDVPSAFSKKLTNRKVQGNSRGRRGTYVGKTPRTSLTPTHPFDHVFNEHEENARSNAGAQGLLGAFPFK